jgi:NADP-dependent 3-hydroxy acid dehydrogenase YdfG
MINPSPPRGVAVVTGASSGIGAATARALAGEGFDVVVGARRLDRCQALADEIGGRAVALDVSDSESVRAFCDAVAECRVLVNNAGGALGLAPIAEFDEDAWRTMYESNVVGVARMTRGLLAKLEASGDGHVITVGSIAAIESYPGGAGYTGAKHAVRSLMEVLRREVLGRPIRVTEIDPGMVETEFSVVRFGGDTDRAAQVYADMVPLSAHDVAECIAFAATRPSHVNIDTMLVMPRDQAAATLIHRHPT